jgi:hypothetical protein
MFEDCQYFGRNINLKQQRNHQVLHSVIVNGGDRKNNITVIKDLL